MRHIAIDVLVLVGLSAVSLTAQTPAADAAAARTVVSAFHTGLQSGDSAGVMRLLAPDALLLEAGGIETRAQYEADHLPADIEFEKAVAVTRTAHSLTVVGDSAWAVTTAELKGTFQDRPIDVISVELMVLSRDLGGWRIRSIHWSGRPRNRPTP